MSYAGRIRDLYAEGGLDEVRRGVRDFILTADSVPWHRLVRSQTLNVGDASATIRPQSREEFWRATGHGETDVMRAFLDTIEPGAVVWDVGANMGSWALLAADAGATVVAFEPGATARARLVANAETSGVRDRIDAAPLALGDWTGTGTLTFAATTAERELVREGTAGDTVPVRRGDDLALPGPDVIKIDVEGAECAVLDGAADTLAAVDVCVVEVHDGVADSAVREHLTGAGLTEIETYTVRGVETIWIARREAEVRGDE